MKSLTTSVYTFADLIADGRLYVDKTAQIHELIAGGKAQLFISRPRRFGKSLLVSTLKAIFQGRKKLFAGLAIETLKAEWPVHPVIHLDMGSVRATTPEELEKQLRYVLSVVATDYGVTLDQDGAAACFDHLVRTLSKHAPVVILVDEYDKPLLGQLENYATAETLLPVLKGFYSVIKTTEAYQRFALITGVSKFAKVSIFSDLNNLDELTFHPRTATLLGYTQEELESNFGEAIQALAAQEGVSQTAMLAKIREWYNGYRYADGAATVYNPVSIGKLFTEMRFKNFWYETGTPAFLLKLMKQYQMPVAELDSLTLPVHGFDSMDLSRLEPEPLLVQTGYLTIRAYDPATRLYTLGYPNSEVRDAFVEHLAGTFTGSSRERSAATAYKLLCALDADDLESFFEGMRIFFDGIDYDLHVKHEKYYQTIFYIILRLLGLYTVQPEMKTARGRIDAVVETASRVYVFEFKLTGTALAALRQIETMDYHRRFMGGTKEVVLVGAVFSPKTRNLGAWKAKRPKSGK